MSDKNDDVSKTLDNIGRSEEAYLRFKLKKIFSRQYHDTNLYSESGQNAIINLFIQVLNDLKNTVKIEIELDDKIIEEIQELIKNRKIPEITVEEVILKALDNIVNDKNK